MDKLEDRMKLLELQLSCESSIILAFLLFILWYLTAEDFTGYLSLGMAGVAIISGIFYIVKQFQYKNKYRGDKK
jgi:hypothetical protein